MARRRPRRFGRPRLRLSWIVATQARQGPRTLSAALARCVAPDEQPPLVRRRACARHGRVMGRRACPGERFGNFVCPGVTLAGRGNTMPSDDAGGRSLQPSARTCGEGTGGSPVCGHPTPEADGDAAEGVAPEQGAAEQSCGPSSSSTPPAPAAPDVAARGGKRELQSSVGLSARSQCAARARTLVFVAGPQPLVRPPLKLSWCLGRVVSKIGGGRFGTIADGAVGRPGHHQSNLVLQPTFAPCVPSFWSPQKSRPPSRRPRPRIRTHRGVLCRSLEIGTVLFGFRLTERPRMCCKAQASSMICSKEGMWRIVTSCVLSLERNAQREWARVDPLARELLPSGTPTVGFPDHACWRPLLPRWAFQRYVSFHDCVSAIVACARMPEGRATSAAQIAGSTVVRFRGTPRSKLVSYVVVAGKQTTQLPRLFPVAISAPSFWTGAAIRLPADLCFHPMPKSSAAPLPSRFQPRLETLGPPRRRRARSSRALADGRPGCGAASLQQTVQYRGTQGLLQVTRCGHDEQAYRANRTAGGRVFEAHDAYDEHQRHTHTQR